MDLELISFRLCPFVQRSVITLRHKSVPHRITYIDLADPPDWFRRISPFGKVPVLRLHREGGSGVAEPARHGACASGGHDPVIFESAVINEYLDEVTPGRLLPEDPVCRAIDRSWIEFATALTLDLSAVMHAREQDQYDSALGRVRDKLAWLEDVLGDGPWFNGAELSLVDFAYAPFFMRTRIIGLDRDLHGSAHSPRSAAWADGLLGLSAVQDSVVAGFPELLISHIRSKAPCAAAALGLDTG